MPFHLLEITVRPDWRELTRQAEVQRLRTWRAVQMAVAGATVVVLLSRWAFPASPWPDLLYMALFSVIGWMLPLWTLQRARQGVRAALSQGVVVYLLLLAAILVAYVTRPMVAPPPAAGAPPSYLPLLALAIPALTWPVLRWMQRAFPTHSARLGLTRERWANQVIIGALAGVALGLHLLLAASWVSGLPQVSSPLALRLLWIFCYQAGLMSLGQELLLRGLAYDALVGGGANSFPMAAAKIVLLNLFVYLAGLALWSSADLLSAAWLLAYGAALSLLATFLRHRQQSLLPGLAASVVFHLFTAFLLGP